MTVSVTSFHQAALSPLSSLSGSSSAWLAQSQAITAPVLPSFLDWGLFYLRVFPPESRLPCESLLDAATKLDIIAVLFK